MERGVWRIRPLALCVANGVGDRSAAGKEGGRASFRAAAPKVVEANQLRILLHFSLFRL